MDLKSISLNRKLKKEIIQWSIVLAIAGTLYFTGLHTEVIGGVQSVVVRTGLIQPDTEQKNERSPAASYDFNIITLDGTEVSFSQFKGKTIFMNLWATWCPPCVAEMPGIQNLYEKLKKENIVFVMISLDENPKKPVRFIAKKQYTFPVYQLASPLPAVFKSTSIPTTFVISPAGKVVLRHEGMADYDNEKFARFVKSL